MQYMAGYSWLAVVISVIAIVVLRYFRTQHNSGLESCFEENRIKARLYIEIYQKWMVVVFAITMISLALFVVGIGWSFYTGKFATC